MKQIDKRFFIKDIERLKNSVSGNPKFRLYLTSVYSDDEYTGTTATDYTIGYEICPQDKNKYITFRYYYTKSGKMVITRLMERG